ncbi:uncharacterized protein LOC135223853 isoform X1 [Macrobrachium nipponense]|uniref:uncharacterized protein LOC135223853 isoform X1 n=1 Tax=Macrobrachium nipponense TaxID=159736 RepID=UPI0030C83150
MLTFTSYPPELQEVPKVRLQGRNVPISSSLLRLKHSPSNIHEADEQRSRNATQKLYQGLAVSGQLASQSPLLHLLSGEPSQDDSVIGRPRPSDKPSKISTDPIPRNLVSGYEDSESGFSGFSVRIENETSLGKVAKILKETEVLREGMDESAGDPFLARTVYLLRKTEPSPSSIPPQSALGQEEDARNKVYSSLGLHERLSTVVERPRQAPGRPFPKTEEPRPSVVFRRLGLGMGSNTGKAGGLGLLEQRTGKLSYQSERTDCSFSGSQGVRKCSTQQRGAGQLRQHDGVGLHQQTRRNPLRVPLQDVKRASSLDETEKRDIIDMLHSRGEECKGRHPEQETSSLGKPGVAHA